MASCSLPTHANTAGAMTWMFCFVSPEVPPMLAEELVSEHGSLHKLWF